MYQNPLLLSDLHGGLVLTKKVEEACVNLMVDYVEKGCGKRNLESSNHFTWGGGDGEDPDDKLYPSKPLSCWNSSVYGYFQHAGC